MKNYINVRFEAYNQEKQDREVKHDLRIVKSKNDKNNLNNYFFDGDMNIEKDNKKLFKKIVDMNKKIREDHQLTPKWYKKRKLKNNNPSTFSGVITFSETHQKLFNDIIKELYKNKKESDEWKKAQKEYQIFMSTHKKCFTRFIDKLKKTFPEVEISLNYASIHLSETTPHWQFQLKNFNPDGSSIFNILRNKEKLSKLQDIAAEAFSDFSVERGVKKGINGVNHHRIENYHKKQLQTTKQEKKELLEELKQLRKIVIGNRNIVGKTAMEVYKEIEEYKKQIKLNQNLKEELNELRERITPKDTLIDKIKDIIYNNESPDIEERYKLIIKEVEEYSKNNNPELDNAVLDIFKTKINNIKNENKDKKKGWEIDI